MFRHANLSESLTGCLLPNTKAFYGVQNDSDLHLESPPALRNYTQELGYLNLQNFLNTLFIFLSLYRFPEILRLSVAFFQKIKKNFQYFHIESFSIIFFNLSKV